MTNSIVKTELHHFVKPINTGANMSIVLPKNSWINEPMTSDEIDWDIADDVEWGVDDDIEWEEIDTN